MISCPKNQWGLKIIVITAIFSLQLANMFIFQIEFLGLALTIFLMIKASEMIGEVLIFENDHVINTLINVLSIFSFNIIYFALVLLFSEFNIVMVTIFLFAIYISSLSIAAYKWRAEDKRDKRPRSTTPTKEKSFPLELYIIFAFIWLIGLATLLKHRSYALIFSVLDALPEYYFLILASLTFVFLILAFLNQINRNVALILASLISSLIFFAEPIVYGISLDPDIWVYLGKVNNVVRFGVVEQVREINHVGYIGLLAFLSVCSSRNPSYYLRHDLLWYITPTLNSIYIPLLTYLMVKHLFNSERTEDIIIAFASLAYLLLGISSGLSIGVNFALPFLLFVTYVAMKFLVSGDALKLLVAISGCVSVIFIEIITGGYSLLVIIIMLAYKFLFHNRKLKIMYYILIVLLSLFIPMNLLYTVNFIHKFYPEFRNVELNYVFSIKNFDIKFKAFFIPNASPYTSWRGNEIPMWFNILRIVVVFFAYRSLKHQRKIIPCWLLHVFICFFINTFITITMLEHFWFPYPLGGGRFFNSLDIITLPFSGYILVKAMAYIFHNIYNVKIIILLYNRKILINFSNIILRYFILLLIINLLYMPVYLRFLGPRLSINGAAPSVSRMTVRAVTASEFEAVQAIIDDIRFNNYKNCIVISHSWFLKIIYGLKDLTDSNIILVDFGPYLDFSSVNEYFKKYNTSIIYVLVTNKLTNQEILNKLYANASSFWEFTDMNIEYRVILLKFSSP